MPLQQALHSLLSRALLQSCSPACSGHLSLLTLLVIPALETCWHQLPFHNNPASHSLCWFCLSVCCTVTLNSLLDLIFFLERRIAGPSWMWTLGTNGGYRVSHSPCSLPHVSIINQCETVWNKTRNCLYGLWFSCDCFMIGVCFVISCFFLWSHFLTPTVAPAFLCLTC